MVGVGFKKNPGICGILYSSPGVLRGMAVGIGAPDPDPGAGFGGNGAGNAGRVAGADQQAGR
jgi:hypothetical protein